MPWAAPIHRPRRGPKRIRDHRDDSFYGTPKWKALRMRFLSIAPLCADPFGEHQKDGQVVPATEVDHVIERRMRPDLAWDWMNMQGLCKRCHSRKTRMEMEER